MTKPEFSEINTPFSCELPAKDRSTARRSHHRRLAASKPAILDEADAIADALLDFAELAEDKWLEERRQDLAEADLMYGTGITEPNPATVDGWWEGYAPSRY
ncbi:hypothetical protein [Cryobacterium sp. N22]|uniref:hypothetical protein n=1 Tax=Cryobacterium sp. N22 TaxID=2048290 RepID=UPI000CE3C347|nr:hypothetical protein [Cryobacterium sp. N22]